MQQKQTVLNNLNKKYLQNTKVKKCMTGLAVFGVFLVARNLYHKLYRKYNSYPPGPDGLPIIGSLLAAFNLVTFMSFCNKKYKSSITLCYIGFSPTVFLHDAYIVNQIFVKQNINNRADHSKRFQAQHLSNKNELALHEIGSDGIYLQKKKKTFRSILVSTLDSEHVNNAHNHALKSCVLSNIDECITNHNGLWYPRKALIMTAFNLLHYVCFNTYLNSLDSPKATKLNELTDDYLSMYMLENVTESFHVNFLWKLLPSSFSEKNNAFKNYERYMEELIYNELGYDETIFDLKNDKINLDEKNDLVSKFFVAHRKHPGQDSSKTAILRELALLFIASGDTTRNSTEYLLALLAQNEELQETIYRELYAVFGEDIFMNKIRLKHEIVNLHKFRAFIHEGLRIGNIAPVGVPHSNWKRDIWVKTKNGKKYCIPKGSAIYADSTTVHYGDDHWKKQTNDLTKKVCLDAWLDKNGKFKFNQNKNEYIPFGIGKRECPGKTLALRNVYSFITKILLRYKLSLKDKNVEFKQVAIQNNVLDPQIPIIMERRKQD